MIFDEELTLLKEKIANAEDMDELNYIRTTNQKKYWWTSIFIAGLFYGLNGKVGKMIITWFVSVITLGIYALYIIYRKCIFQLKNIHTLFKSKKKLWH